MQGGPAEKSQAEKSVVTLAQRFLSLPTRDQGTLSRVAEALQAGPAQG